MAEKMKGALVFTVCLLAHVPALVSAQAPATIPAATFSPGQDIGEPRQTDQRPVSWKQLLPNVLDDQKHIWLFPKDLAEGKHWKPAAAFVLGTGALIALDPEDTPYFRRTQTFSDFNRIASSRNAIIGIAAVPAALYLTGLARNDQYMQNTVELAGEAILDGEVVDLVMRDVSRRLSPSEILPNGNFSNTWFRRNKGLIYVGSGGFPSGHMVAAVSLATVLSRRYPNHRWVPWVAYGLTGMVGFSRITLSDHFPSDVFAGAFLGYAITRFDVLRLR
jgi:PAP2 superfamily protein